MTKRPNEALTKLDHNEGWHIECTVVLEQLFAPYIHSLVPNAAVSRFHDVLEFACWNLSGQKLKTPQRSQPLWNG